MQPEIEEKNGGWVLRIPASNGRVQELQCATEDMARRMASSLTRKAPVRPQVQAQPAR